MLLKVVSLVLAVTAGALAAPADGSGSGPPSFRSDYKYYEPTHAFYKYHSIRRRWSDAVSTCQAEGAFLPAPATKAESDALVAQFSDSNTNEATWIALHDMFSEGDFQTVDGRDLSQLYLDWGMGEPNDFHNDEDCVILRIDGTYNDESCSKTYRFICMKDLSSVTSNPICETYDTAYNRTTEPNRCYKLHTTPSTWNNAYMMCKAEQANLVIINSEAEAKVLAKMLSLYPIENLKGNFRKEYIHVGFNDLINSGTYVSIDGTPLEESGYNVWAENQPDNYEGKEHCGSLYRNGGLNDGDCSVKAFFVCEKVLKNTSGPSSTSSPPPESTLIE